ncbi:MAG TPA: hypothetical protein VMG40_02425 [Bryobacteraceae bacterium]|nr:hypothetical protein [Bryobacteraceae bacterium]
MALRDEIQKKIDRKRADIEALELQLRDAKIYVQALEDTLKMLPRETAADAVALTAGAMLRVGSKADKARQAIRAAGKPLHVTELLKALGIPNKADQRQALAGSLSSYARKQEIFTRPAPNTFGLVGLESRPPAENTPPPNFGKDQPSGRQDNAPEADLEGDTLISIDDDMGDYGIDEEEEQEVAAPKTRKKTEGW